MTTGRDGDRRDADPDDGRNETETERLDRNWNALLQELRVLETGTQILTGFLLISLFGVYQILLAVALGLTALGLVVGGLARRLPRRALLSMSLGDERVLVARSPAVGAAQAREGRRASAPSVSS